MYVLSSLEIFWDGISTYALTGFFFFRTESTVNQTQTLKAEDKTNYYYRISVNYLL